MRDDLEVLEWEACPCPILHDDNHHILSTNHEHDNAFTNTTSTTGPKDHLSDFEPKTPTRLRPLRRKQLALSKSQRSNRKKRQKKQGKRMMLVGNNPGPEVQSVSGGWWNFHFIGEGGLTARTACEKLEAFVRARRCTGEQT